MSNTDKQSTSTNPAPVAAQPVKFVHEIGSQYRVIHGDGVWGAVNNQGNIQLDFYVERPPRPTAVIHPTKPDGMFTGEQITEGDSDPNHFLVVRDFQAGVVLSLAAAMQAYAVLGNFIKLSRQQMDAVVEQIKQQK